MGKNLTGTPGSLSRDYEREDDHRTLTRAAEIMGDRARMNGAKSHHRKQKKALSLVQKTMLQGRR